MGGAWEKCLGILMGGGAWEKCLEVAGRPGLGMVLGNQPPKKWSPKTGARGLKIEKFIGVLP